MVYASPKSLFREELWLYIRQLGRVFDISCVLVVDVNQPLDIWDKSGGRMINKRQANKLRNTIDGCQFIDMVYRDHLALGVMGGEEKKT